VTGRPDEPRDLIRYGLTGAALTLILLWTLYLAREALLLVYIAALLAIGIAPLAVNLERLRVAGYRLPRWAAVLVIYIVIAGILVGIGSLVVPPLIEQATGLAADLPQMLDRFQQWLIGLGILARPITVREAVEQSPVGGETAIGGLIGAVIGVAGGVFGVVTVAIVAFYLLMESDSLVRTFVRLFPRTMRAQAAEACQRVSTKVSAWLGGQLLLAAIIGVSAAIGLYLLGVPYFYVLALIAAVGETIPIVGPLLAAVPAVGVALTVSPAAALGVAVFFLVQQQIENHVLVPRIMSRQVGVSPVVVIVSLMVGGSLLGILGVILAVPTAAIVQVAFEEIVSDGNHRSGG
jgi:predicted PurR-regulated permease PerM